MTERRCIGTTAGAAACTTTCLIAAGAASFGCALGAAACTGSTAAGLLVTRLSRLAGAEGAEGEDEAVGLGIAGLGGALLARLMWISYRPGVDVDATAFAVTACPPYVPATAGGAAGMPPPPPPPGAGGMLDGGSEGICISLLPLDGGSGGGHMSELPNGLEDAGRPC